MTKFIFRRGSLTKLLYLFVLLVTISYLSASGCSNNSSNSNIIGPNGGTVTSSDGRCTLEIPSGALTESTEISVILNDDIEGTFIVYDALPDGLEFSMPAILSCDVSDISNNDENNINVIIGFSFSENSVEQLGNQENEVDFENGDSIYKAELSHFSKLVLFDKGIVIEHSTVPSSGLANSFLTNFNADVTTIPITFTDSIGNSQQITPVLEPNDSAYFKDFSQPMVIYNGPGSEFSDPQIEFEEIFVDGSVESAFLSNVPYNCGNVGPGIFKMEIGISGKLPSGDDLAQLVIIMLGSFGLGGIDEGFDITVPGMKNVTCTSTDTPPPPPATEPPMMPPPATDAPPPTEPVSISADTEKINIVHNRGSSPCPQRGDPVKITVMGGEGEFRIVVKEKLPFLTVTPGNKLTNMGMVTLTPSFPCDGFIVGMNNGTITVEVQDPDTGEVLDTIEIPVIVTVN